MNDCHSTTHPALRLPAQSASVGPFCRLARPNRAARRRPSGRRGFTLLELLLVLAVVGMLVALVVPSMLRSAGETVLDRQAMELVKVLAQVRTRAIETGSPVQFVWQAGDGSFLLVEESSAAATGTETPIVSTSTSSTAASSNGPAATAGAGEEHLLAEGILFGGAAVVGAGTAESSSLTFYSDGTSSGGLIVLTAEDGPSREISVRDLTGMATLSRTVSSISSPR